MVKVIPQRMAAEFIKKHHYSGKIVQNSYLHFGCFLNGELHGAMSFGNPMDKRRVLGLVVDQEGNPAKWNEMLELNRMAFDDVLPKNSESRCIGFAIKLIKKNAPHIRWILSFADGTHCGDGTIYRASNFKLTGLTQGSMVELPERLWKLNGGGDTHTECPFRASPDTFITQCKRNSTSKADSEPWNGTHSNGEPKLLKGIS